MTSVTAGVGSFPNLRGRLSADLAIVGSSEEVRERHQR
jgi:hypothetical protein